MSPTHDIHYFMQSPTLGRILHIFGPFTEPRVGLVVAADPEFQTIKVRIFDPSVEMKDTQHVIPDIEDFPSKAGIYWKWPPRN